MSDQDAFGKLAKALSPWHAQLVFIGGWAHRLYRLHPEASPRPYQPIATLDADIAFAEGERLAGSIKARLTEAGFNEQLTGTHRPPISQYTLGDEGASGFYAEFLTPLTGSGRTRAQVPLVTVERAGVTAQRLRHLELMLLAPWSVELPSGWGVDTGTIIKLPNPVSFIVHKLLIHELRQGNKKAQDVLYIHDTVDLFGGDIENLTGIWRDTAKPSMHANQIRQAIEANDALFGRNNDTLRDSAAIPQDRDLNPERMRLAIHAFLHEMFNA